MTMAASELKSLHGMSEVLLGLLESDTPIDVSEFGQARGMPKATIYRYLSSLRAAGLIVRQRRGSYVPHPHFLRLLRRHDPNHVLGEYVRPYLQKLSADLGTTVHFGVLEDDMVTYIVKVEVDDETVFTQENQQLEAYCSAIGKVLLANLPSAAIDEYLAVGDFPYLTPKTVTHPGEIRKELARTRRRGYGMDSAEVDKQLYCLAVPVRDGRGNVLGAISASRRSEEFVKEMKRATLISMRRVADDIQGRL